MMHSMRAFVAGATLLAAAAGTAEAQVNYTTTGRFTSGTAACNQLVAANSVSCAFGSFTLLYTGTTAADVASGSVVSFGTFRLTGTGSATVPPPSITFDLFVNQTSPDVGSATFMGAISGTISTEAGGGSSTLVWAPNRTGTIGMATYTIIYDNAGPGVDRGLGLPINNDRGINALVNVVPEPSTYLLMGTGLVALVVTARRRKVS